MKEKTTYGCRMWVDTGDEHPDVFTALTGIQPTSIKVKGKEEVLKNGGSRIMKQNLWELEPPIREADDEWDLCECIVDITEILDEEEVEVRAALNKFDNKGLMFYCDMYRYWVQFRIQPEVLRKIQKYNILVDFSILSFDDKDDYEWQDGDEGEETE